MLQRLVSFSRQPQYNMQLKNPQTHTSYLNQYHQPYASQAQIYSPRQVQIPLTKKSPNCSIISLNSSFVLKKQQLLPSKIVLASKKKSQNRSINIQPRQMISNCNQNSVLYNNKVQDQNESFQNTTFTTGINFQQPMEFQSNYDKNSFQAPEKTQKTQSSQQFKKLEKDYQNQKQVLDELVLKMQSLKVINKKLQKKNEYLEGRLNQQKENMNTQQSLKEQNNKPNQEAQNSCLRVTIEKQKAEINQLKQQNQKQVEQINTFFSTQDQISQIIKWNLEFMQKASKNYGSETLENLKNNQDFSVKQENSEENEKQLQNLLKHISSLNAKLFQYQNDMSSIYL